MKRLNLPLSLAVAAAATLAPVGVRAVPPLWTSANICTTGSLVLCDAFSLSLNGSGQFVLTVVNDVTPPSNIADPGFLTGLALFYTGGTPIPGFTAVSGDPTTGWTLVDNTTHTGSGCNDVGSGVVNQNDIVLGNCTNGSSTAQMVSVTFTTTLSQSALIADLEGGTILIAGDHVQSVGPLSCSLKFYSNGDIVSNGQIVTDIDSNCGTTTVPEPLSMVLLGSGLLGLALPAARLHRRKQEEEEE